MPSRPKTSGQYLTARHGWTSQLKEWQEKNISKKFSRFAQVQLVSSVPLVGGQVTASPAPGEKIFPAEPKEATECH